MYVAPRFTKLQNYQTQQPRTTCFCCLLHASLAKRKQKSPTTTITHNLHLCFIWYSCLSVCRQQATTLTRFFPNGIHTIYNTVCTQVFSYYFGRFIQYTTCTPVAPVVQLVSPYPTDRQGCGIESQRVRTTFSHIMSFFSRIRSCQWKARSVCTQWEEEDGLLLTIKIASQAPQKVGASGRGAFCVTTVQMFWPDAPVARRPANSGNKCEDKQKIKQKKLQRSVRVRSTTYQYSCRGTEGPPKHWRVRLP